MDPDCAVCHSLQEASEALGRISTYISLSQPKIKKDFGLYRSLVETQIKEISKMQKYHEYYHATGESLSDVGSGLNSPPGDSFRPRRYRPS